jgi:hypothetical protein
MDAVARVSLWAMSAVVFLVILSGKGNPAEILFGKEQYPGELKTITALCRALMVVSMAVGCKIQPVALNLALLAAYVAVLVQAPSPLWELGPFLLIAGFAAREVLPAFAPSSQQYSGKPARTPLPKALRASTPAVPLPIVAPVPFKPSPPRALLQSTAPSPISQSPEVQRAKRLAMEKLEVRRRARVEELRA